MSLWRVGAGGELTASIARKRDVVQCEGALAPDADGATVLVCVVLHEVAVADRGHTAIADAVTLDRHGTSAKVNRGVVDECRVFDRHTTAAITVDRAATAPGRVGGEHDAHGGQLRALVHEGRATALPQHARAVALVVLRLRRQRHATCSNHIFIDYAAAAAAAARGSCYSGRNCSRSRQQERRAHPHAEEAQQRGAEDFEEGLHLQSKAEQSGAKQSKAEQTKRRHTSHSVVDTLTPRDYQYTLLLPSLAPNDHDSLCFGFTALLDSEAAYRAMSER